jgi:hypothetical protein
MAVRTTIAREDLQQMLERLSPGDEINVGDAARTTGLDAHTCETVFEALVRVGLFTRRAGDGVFVRVPMLGVVDRLHL